jgi:hypothetical protein
MIDVRVCVYTPVGAPSETAFEANGRSYIQVRLAS